MSETDGPTVESTASKPKRVRTGCLTCRERHLKCDEALPHCQNCRKSNRLCKRGIRLNFIDTQVQAPPVVPTSQDWHVSFLDESRDIASEYKGGLSKYGAPEVQAATTQAMNGLALDFSTTSAAPDLSHQQPLPPIQGMLPDMFHDDGQNMIYDTTQPGPAQMFQTASPTKNRDYLNSQEEVLFMQVFVEEVGLWMDSMDPQKHFSRLLPFHALNEPMLLHAFLACGARHLSLVNARYTEDKALHYYDTATRHLLASLQNPNRDTVICATTAVILNVYEIMCEKALQRMNHIAGARALIKDCGWNARSTGIGAACFWLNVGMELLSCLHFNWQVAWDPDEWGVDMDFSRETEAGREEAWAHRIVYVVAKICNFRASAPRKPAGSPRDEQLRMQKRFAEWQRLKGWCDSWNDCIPRTMHPMAYLYPFQTSSQSAFPEVWLIKRTTIVARLFYHTALCLLAQTHPALSRETDEMRELMVRNSQLICGIVAHVKDRGVASVALRSLAIAAECLATRREQEEVLQILDKIRQETGWRVGFINTELKKQWGWQDDLSLSSPASMQFQGAVQPQTTTIPMSLPSAPAPPPSAGSVSSSTSNGSRPRLPSGILNPMLTAADFSLPQHPYQNYYVAPNLTSTQGNWAFNA
ncbi:hypothetical protein IWX49DRAFT_161062 [Phyllosticta citricarpa]|uniref:Zn(2)-C6 fungal-type domain-containing protein n=2 Tax=Phyllosticta TaxID=121621 RepID=A0ABR1M6C1_9PEZI